ncbi:MAG: hypothetical protein NDP22_01065 [Crenarchaeota archaeon]|nr:hypothetical protein [Thermoproteota archaeon]
MPILVMIVSKHPLPLGDDSRFIGYVKAISEEGRWTSYKYRENPYYQPFPIIPFLEYTLASVAGLSLENITPYYLTLKLCFYFVYLLYVYLIMNKLFGDQFVALIAMLLLSITPPLALTTSSQVVHQAYAVIASLAAVYMGLREFKTKQFSISGVLITFPLWISGIVAHATYTLIVLAFMVSAIIDSILSEEKTQKNIARSAARRLVLLSIISLSYWIYTYILDALCRPVISSLVRLVEIFTGNLPSLSTQVAPYWYTSESQVFFISWALIPSLAASCGLYIVVDRMTMKIFKLRRCKDSYSNLTIILGFIGLSALTLNYLGRSVSWIYGQNFYWLYLLILPLSTQNMISLLRRPLSSMISLVLISLITFYAVQDPTLSGNTYGNYIGWADSHSWKVAHNIASLLPSYVTFIGDPRIEVPLSCLRFYMNIAIEYPLPYQVPKLLIAGNDWIGDRTIKGAESWYHISLLDRQRNVVFTTCSYVMYQYLS